MAKVRALTHMPDPTSVKQLRSLLGGLRYYFKLLRHLATRCTRPLPPSSKAFSLSQTSY